MFESEIDKIRILEDTSWSVHRNLLIIKEWTHNKTIEEIDFSTENI